MAYDKTLLTDEQVKSFLAEHAAWTRKNDELRRTYEFKSFPESLAFVAKLEQPAESANHHPDIDIRWNKVTLGLTTHDAGGLTFRDTDLAKVADQLFGR